MDWQFEPENPLGKRAKVRLANSDMCSLFGVKSIPVKVVIKDFDGKGYLVDIAQSGLAVVLGTKLVQNQQVKIGLFIGRRKVFSRAIVRNVSNEQGRHRTGKGAGMSIHI